jgi:predicted kinase
MIQQVAEDEIKYINANIDKYSRNNIVYVCGPMGSGKSTYIKHKLVRCGINAYYSSIDELQHYFVNETTHPQELYQLCRKVGIIVTDYLLENNISMVIEGTGINMDMVEYLQRLKLSGYKIKTIFLKTSLETCLTRVSKRNETDAHKVILSDIEKYYNILWNGSMEKEKMETQYVNISDSVLYVYNYDVNDMSCQNVTLS